MVFLVNINKSKINTSAGKGGKIKDVGGVNGSPISVAPGFPDLEDQFNQMGITHVRLHDIFGIGDIDDGFVANRLSNQNQLMLNVPRDSQEKAKTFIAEYGNKRTIFPYAAAGMRANNLNLAMKNVNYKPTDSYIKRILDNNASVNPNNIQRQVMFRVGRTLDGGYEIPENFDIYTTLVGELVKRYSLNYQSIGLPRKVTYWEIWNEPDLTFFWNNNNAQVYYEFYSKIARMIKSIDPDAKVGGCGVANGYNPGGAYIDGLLNYCRRTGTPIDFLSWHFYANLTADPQNFIDIGNSIQTALNKYGYSNIESICTEWNSSPFGRVNILSNVQSATNAAYLTSALIFMQYCKTDKAYYYRGDASSFGLFNDVSNPADSRNKNFCTCAAQGFHLFSRMHETPNILSHDNQFNTGLATLAAQNDAGNKINIIAANYQVDMSFVSGTVTKYNYKQHYLDTNRTVNQLNDSWSIEHWFGGVDPSTVTFDNTVTQKTVVSQLPTYGYLKARARTYTQSNTGVGFQINNISSGYTSFKLTAYRVIEGTRLDRMTASEVSSSIQTYFAGGVLKITDTGAKPSTVTLYSIELVGRDNNNGNGGNGNGGNGNGNGNGGNGNGNGNISGLVRHTVKIPIGKKLPIRDLLPPNYVFTANKRYKIALISMFGEIYTCPGNTVFNAETQSCDSNLAKTFDIEADNLTFTPYISGILYKNTNLNGNAYVGAGQSGGYNDIIDYVLIPQ
ncbi:GH39 family glycosyl hydrolase [Commensalibacter nepenthis]|uniref:Glycoside hydrolase family 39 n=1 Tax=Commensalibacter nepenthis TaxID=3043872 RepID=A0ABT6Q5M2_9PROT|nr:glycoside hydrolase family 39 [Commensalibacter sp. TBRC 10068]MDI2112196.1 glycoside hydrolase family 39 [Commensalibacter sp. TBRC 10068]